MPQIDQFKVKAIIEVEGSSTQRNGAVMDAIADKITQALVKFSQGEYPYQTHFDPCKITSMTIDIK